MSQGLLIEGLLKEITPHFNPSEDIQTIKRVETLQRDTEAVLKEKQMQMKRIIKEISDSVNMQKEEIARRERGEDEARRLEAALEQKENEQLKLEALKTQGAVLEQRVKEVQALQEDVSEQMQELERTKLAEIPLIKHALTLFSNVSNIKWDYDSVDNRWKGLVAKADDCREFDLPVHGDGYDATQKLWELM